MFEPEKHHKQMNVRDFPIDISVLSNDDCRRFSEEIACAMDLHNFLAKLTLRIESCGEMSLSNCISEMILPRSTVESNFASEKNQSKIKDVIRLSHNMKSQMSCSPPNGRITLECVWKDVRNNRTRGKLKFYIHKNSVKVNLEIGCLVENPIAA